LWDAVRVALKMKCTSNACMRKEERAWVNNLNYTLEDQNNKDTKSKEGRKRK
jgi:hypothetical protein